MDLSSILNPAIIDLSVEGTTKDEVLRNLAQVLLRNGYIDDVEQFISDIYEREAEGPTGMGEGISIPHGKSTAAKKIGIAIGRTVNPIRWESSMEDDGWQESTLVFLFCVFVDTEFAANHLMLLSQLAGKLGNEARLARLHQCPTRSSPPSLLRTRSWRPWTPKKKSWIWIWISDTFGFLTAPRPIAGTVIR